MRLELSAPLPVLVRVEYAGQPALAVMAGGTRALVWRGWVWEERLTYTPRRRGEHTLPSARVFVKDLLGLRERELLVEQPPAQILAYPEAFELPSPDLRLTLLGEGPEAQGGLEDPGRFAGVRDYQAGDPLSRLHWKATARQGRPMVREFARVRSSGVWLHLDAQAGGKTGEVYLEHAAALAASLLRAAEGQNLAVGASIGAAQIGLGRGADHLARLLEALAKARLEAAACPVPAPPPGVNLILITHQAAAPVVEGALRARARASRVHLVALPEGFYLRPGEAGRRVFGVGDDVARLYKKRSLLEAEGVRVHVLRGNELVTRVR